MIALLLLTSLASASPDASPWSLVGGLGAELPVSTGAMATLEGPGRLRLGGSVGRLPGLLVYSAGEATESSGLLEADAAEALSDGLGSALVLGGSVGWRPFRQAGIWMQADLRTVRVSASASPQVVASALGVETVDQPAGKGSPAPTPSPAVERYTLSVRADLVGGSVGWDWVLAEHVVLRFSAGGLVLHSGRSSVESGAAGAATEPEAAQPVTDGLESVFTRRLFTPTLGLGVGWRFG